MNSYSSFDNLPLVSIITVNFNQTEVTAELLDSLRKISYSPIEIIVVDNGSSKKIPATFKEKFPEVIFIESEKNLGFAGGNNLGLKYVHGKYCLFLNNDTEVSNDFLEPMVKAMENNENLGVVSPKIRFHHSPQIIQYAGYTKMNTLTIRNNLIGYRQKDEGQYNISKATCYGHGAAMMIPYKVIEKVGLMADIFFLYYEEHDWFERIKNAGYSIYYIANSLVYHKESISTGKESPLKIHYIARNRILFQRRNIHGLKFLISLLFQVFVSVPKNYLNYLIKGRFDLFLAFHKAMLWNLKNSFNKELFKSPTLKSNSHANH